MREKKMRTKLLKLLRTAPYIEGTVSFETLVDHLIANGVTIAGKTAPTEGWIPVTERLPEHGKVCLICARYNEMFIRQWDAVVKMWIGDASQYDFPVSAVTHWMPRPVPPKEGEDNA